MSAAAGYGLAQLAGQGIQGTFDELGTPLRETTFVVVDLETTGEAPETARITEIGAVKARGGDVLGEFQTLVNPETAIPAFIAVLTGITDGMVAGAPRLGAVVPAFLEFAAGSVLVAHNAPYDVAFLKAACAAIGADWPGFAVIDTARLARRIVTGDEAPDCRLATLAQLFRSSTTPIHRALADARATVDVLHGLLERVGGLGVQSLEELATFSARVSPAQRAKRHLAEPLPHAPGVYLFLDGRGQALYVGKSKDIRARVRSYFTASEMRSRMAEMVGLAESVRPIVCATALEAEVRELRLIAEHKPRYNRRSRYPERALYLKLTREAFPRLSVVRGLKPGDTAYLGPFSSPRTAELAMYAAQDAFRLRQCTSTLSVTRPTSACALFEMGRCGAPCTGNESVDAYATHVSAAGIAMHSDPRALVDALTTRIDRLGHQGRYEEAAHARDRLIAFVRTAARMQRLEALTGCPEMVAARPTAERGWELAVVRYGRLAAAGVVPVGVPPRPHVDALRETAETVVPAPGPTPASSSEETECVLRWLETPGTRLVELEGTWCSPRHGAGRLRDWLDTLSEHPQDRDDRRHLRTLHRPAR